MFDAFAGEIYQYAPYKNKPNDPVPEALLRRLNSRGTITGFVFNTALRLQVREAFRSAPQAYGTQLSFLHSQATIYSDSRPINLDLYESYYISSTGILGERDMYPTSLALVMSYHGTPNSHDIGFIRRCLRESRFFLVRPEEKEGKERSKSSPAISIKRACRA